METTAQRKGRKSRFLAGLPAELRVDDAVHACTAYNLSRSGALLIGALPACAAPTVEVTLRSMSGDRSLTIVARAVRMDADEDTGQSRLGVEFPALDAEQQASLDALIARVLEAICPALVASLAPNAKPAEVRQVLEQVPLAQRMALAVRAGPRERELLFHDSSPPVLESLARNGSITPVELRRLARRGELPVGALETIAREPRWEDDEEVQVALASHPRTPIETAVLCASRLAPPARQRVLRHPGLRTALALRLLKTLPDSAKRR
jgi:hypothetical protein